MRGFLTALLTVALLGAFALPAEAGWEEGVQAFQSGNFSVAAQEFQGVTESRPDWAGGFLMLGQALSKLNRHQDAVNAYRKAYDLDPNDVRIQLALSNGYLAMQRYADAARLLQQIDANGLPQAQRATYHNMLSVALEKSGQSDQALVALREAARANPRDSDAQYRYGIAAFNSGDTDTGVTALGRAVELAPNDASRRQALVQALVRQAREKSSGKQAIYGRAAEQAQALVRSAPTYDNYLTLGETLLGAKRYAPAVDAFNQAIAKNADAWLPYFYRSQAETALERFTAAEESLVAALARNPRGNEERMVYRQVGFVNEKQRDFEEAKTAYARAGDQASLARVEENQRIAEENLAIEEENARIREMEAERERLRRELEQLEGGEPPPF